MHSFVFRNPDNALTVRSETGDFRTWLFDRSELHVVQVDTIDRKPACSAENLASGRADFGNIFACHQHGILLAGQPVDDAAVELAQRCVLVRSRLSKRHDPTSVDRHGDQPGEWY